MTYMITYVILTDNEMYQKMLLSKTSFRIKINKLVTIKQWLTAKCCEFMTNTFSVEHTRFSL